MNLLERFHGDYVHGRRVRVLASLFAELIPPQGRVLDVGCGDGWLGQLIFELRPDIKVCGIDVLVRRGTKLPMVVFDGSVIPYADRSFDAVMFADVLHHTNDPMVLLREAARVAGEAVLIKDHTVKGTFAKPILRVMDWVGNARHGVMLPYNYWTEQQWNAAFDAIGLRVGSICTDLKLYPAPADWFFGRSLHFLARLEVPQTPETPAAGRLHSA